MGYTGIGHGMIQQRRVEDDRDDSEDDSEDDEIDVVRFTLKAYALPNRAYIT